ncbi:hypothetical protein C8R48DRAFT_772536 [Suillus tomentosus]|nr:hypothetical protein C8R48DRAFT_772536 [Suillus tomentosus]
MAVKFSMIYFVGSFQGRARVEEGGLNEHFAAAAAMMHMGPPIDTLQDHQLRWSATLLSQNYLRPYSNPPLSRAASLILASQTSQTGTCTENTEANDPHPRRCAKRGSRNSAKVTRQMMHYQQEDQDVITTA